MSEKLCLKWNKFQENINSAFESLREDSDFTDVTLACEDGHQIEAHKVILAASSPFFKGLFKRIKHANLLVYMRGVLSENLTAIIDFLYLGEANVYQENLDSFLAIAEELKLKGLMNCNDDNEAKEAQVRSTEIGQESQHVQKQEEVKYMKEKNFTNVRKISNPNFENLVIPGSEDFAELDEKIKSMMEKSENYVSCQRKDGKRAFASICKVCRKEGNGADIKRHIEAIHLEGTSISCNFCENIFTTRDTLRKHRKNAHSHVLA